MRTGAALAGLLGGLCWIGAYVVDAVSPDGPVDPLTWAGAVLLGLAALGAGAGLVSRSATALRVFVAVCFAVLLGSLLEMVRDAGDALVVDALAGAVAAVVAVVVLSRRPARPAPVEAPVRAGHRAVRGSHAR